MARLSLFLTVAVILQLTIAVSSSNDDSATFYGNTCPRASSIVAGKVIEATIKDRGLPAALLRLIFHDCFVRGCDASITLDSTLNNPAEKDGAPNANSVRGYELIDDVKATLETVCPGVVSCADIIALAARDAIVAAAETVLSSHALETVTELPSPFANYSTLVQMFANKGFDEREVVVLSGSHTIGVTHCRLIESRLYNGTGPAGVDPSLDAAYAAQLKTHCRFSVDAAKPIFLDPTNGGNRFDSNYFSNALKNKGLFTVDTQLVSNSTSRSLIKTQASNRQFFKDFGKAMEKMVNLQLITAPEGQIRKNCRVVNA